MLTRVDPRRAGVTLSLPGSVSVRPGAAGDELWLSGEVDSAVVRAFEQAHGAEAGVVTVLDCGEVTYIGSLGVSLLVRWSRAARSSGGTAVLRRSSPRLDRVLLLTGLTDEFARPGE
jgi:anti-anti-sigma factor